MNNQISEPTQTQLRKYDDLKKMIKGFGSVAVAFSGGVDSTFFAVHSKRSLRRPGDCSDCPVLLFPKTGIR